MPAHELKGRGTSVLVKHNRLAPNRISVREITNPRELVTVNVLEGDRGSPRFYVPDAVIAPSTAIKHENRREAALMIHHGVMIPAIAVMSGTTTRSAPLAVVRIIIPVAPTIVTVRPVVAV